MMSKNQKEQAAAPVLTTDQTKARQQRFDQLKQRLLQNSQIRQVNRRQVQSQNADRPKPIERSLSQDKEKIKENLKDIESVFNYSQEMNAKRSSKPAALQYGNYQFFFDKPEAFHVPSSPISHNNAAAPKSMH